MARAGGITNAVNVGIAVQADWENREFISHISLNVRRLFDFLVQFGKNTFPSLPNDPSRCRFIIRETASPLCPSRYWVSHECWSTLNHAESISKFEFLFCPFEI